MKALIFVITALISSLALSNELVKQKIEKVAINRGEDPILLLAISKVESSYNKKAIGKVGEIGLFQLRPEFFNININMNIEEQAHIAIDLLQKLKVRCKERFLQCWNMGTTRALKKNYKVTKYEIKVRNAYKDLLHSRSFSPIKSKNIAREVFK